MGEGLAAQVTLKMIQALAAGVSAVDAYNSIYKTSISWKNANNTISNVQLETIGEALEQCMAEVGGIKTGVNYDKVCRPNTSTESIYR